MSTFHTLLGDGDDARVLTLGINEVSDRFTLDLYLPESAEGDDDIEIARFTTPRELVALAERLIQIASYYDSTIEDPLLTQASAGRITGNKGGQER